MSLENTVMEQLHQTNEHNYPQALLQDDQILVDSNGLENMDLYLQKLAYLVYNMHQRNTVAVQTLHLYLMESNQFELGFSHHLNRMFQKNRLGVEVVIQAPVHAWDFL
jgi:hypothetical protein